MECKIKSPLEKQLGLVTGLVLTPCGAKVFSWCSFLEIEDEPFLHFVIVCDFPVVCGGENRRRKKRELLLHWEDQLGIDHLVISKSGFLSLNCPPPRKPCKCLEESVNQIKKNSLMRKGVKGPMGSVLAMSVASLGCSRILRQSSCTT